MEDKEKEGKKSYLEVVTDAMSEGIIAIDIQGKIKVYNDKAKKIFGLEVPCQHEHPSGRVETGDIVLIANNSLGGDDGGLCPEDLEVLGIDSSYVQQGDALVAIGILGGSQDTVVYQTAKNHNKQHKLAVNNFLNGVFLESAANLDEKFLTITVGDTSFTYNYLMSAGHLVLLDAESMALKFYQTPGYTARGEDARYILFGKEFQSKSKTPGKYQVLDSHIKQIHPFSPIIDDLVNAVETKANEYFTREAIINGIPVRCSITSLNNEDPEMKCAVLRILDISEIKTLINERDKALALLETMEQADNKTELSPTNEIFQAFVGVSEKIKQVLYTAERASRSRSTVMLLGESGTGKGALAELIHQASARANQPFVHVNCASIPDQLLESELFGYEKGAFTGASHTGKKGKFELAHQGTLFLDEIGEMPLNLQVKLLNFLQKRSFTRVGGVNEIAVDVRVITATNRDIDQAVKTGDFREDLYYRINVMAIFIPPLRERKEDIYPLIDYLLPRICAKLETENKRVSIEVMKLFMEYPWYGNVRELENVLERAVNMCDGSMIFLSHLPESFKLAVSKSTQHSAISDALELKQLVPLPELKKQAEIKAIQKALELCNGNRKQAFKLLRIGKTNFYNKLHQYGFMNHSGQNGP